MMEYLLNLGPVSIVLVGLSAFSVSCLFAIINIYSAMGLLTRILVNTAIVALPLVAWYALEDAAGWPKIGLPGNFVYIEHEITFSEVGDPENIVVLLRKVEVDEGGYDKEIGDPRLHVIDYTREDNSLMEEARERKGKGRPTIVRDNTQEEVPGDGKEGELPTDLTPSRVVGGFNLPPKGLLVEEEWR